MNTVLACTRELGVPVLWTRAASDVVINNDNESASSHKEIYAKQDISLHETRRYPQQPKKQEADGYLGERSANQNRELQGEVPFPYLNLLSHR